MKDKMELEEAIKYIRTILRQKELPDAAKSLGYVYAVEAIETVLQALKNLQEENCILKNRQCIGKFMEVNIENLSEVLSPYYIPKKKIENLLEEVYTDEGIGYELDKDEKPGAVRVLRKILEDK